MEPVSIPRVVPSDPDDDHVIAAAVTAHASLIVLGDTDLLSMNSHQGLTIITAVQALQLEADGVHQISYE